MLFFLIITPVIFWVCLCDAGVERMPLRLSVIDSVVRSLSSMIAIPIRRLVYTAFVVSYS